VTHNLATTYKPLVESEFGNGLVAKKRLLKAKKSNKRQMNYCENECTPQGTCIYRGEVTSRYKKYREPVLVGFSGISDGLVTSFFRETRMEPF
jgi:hypothetical protein